MVRVRRIKIPFIMLLLATFLLSGVFNMPSSMAMNNDASSNIALSNNNISMNIRNADIRDVLSAIAVNMSKNIIYTGQPVDVNFNIQNMDSSTALDYFLKTYGMDYIENKNTIIVGTHDTLTKDFLSSVSLTKFSLKYVDSDIIASQIEALGIAVQKVTLDSNKNVIWVQGMPNDLGMVRELISMLDKSENINQASSSTLLLTPIALTYITAEQMNGMLKEMGIPVGIILNSNPMTLWVYGNNAQISQISDIKKKVDIADNAQSENFVLTAKKMKFLTIDEIIPILDQLAIDVNIITFERSLQTLWFSGDEESIKLASSVIDKFDVLENSENVFFVHTLTNITAKEAEKRLAYLDIKGIKTYTFNFPEFSKKMMVFCPSDYKLFAITHLNRLDIMTEKISVPIDYSDVSSGRSKLLERRDLIVDMTGIPAASFIISDNVSRDSTSHFIMYLKETSEVIQRVKDLIKFIDNPTSEAQE